VSFGQERSPRSSAFKATRLGNRAQKGWESRSPVRLFFFASVHTPDYQARQFSL